MKQPSAKEHFEAHADSWLADHYGEASYVYPTPRHRIRIVLDILSTLSPGLNIVDIGCGGGDLALALVEQGHTVVGLDQSERMVEIAEGRSLSLAEDEQSKVRFMVRGIDQIDVPPSSFDVVTSMGVIGYLDNDDDLFRAALGGLKPGGLFVVSCRNRLFNLNSLSHRTVREFDSGAAPALIEEMAEYCQDVPFAEAEAFVGRLRGLPETSITRASQSDTVGAPAGDENTDHLIEARQHTPRELTKTATRHGLISRGFHGVNPHLIDPRLNRLLPPGVFNLVSSALEAFENLPVSLLWSSVFIGVFEKPAD